MYEVLSFLSNSAINVTKASLDNKNGQDIVGGQLVTIKRVFRNENKVNLRKSKFEIEKQAI